MLFRYIFWMLSTNSKFKRLWKLTVFPVSRVEWLALWGNKKWIKSMEIISRFDLIFHKKVATQKTIFFNDYFVVLIFLIAVKSVPAFQKKDKKWISLIKINKKKCSHLQKLYMAANNLIFISQCSAIEKAITARNYSKFKSTHLWICIVRYFISLHIIYHCNLCTNVFFLSFVITRPRYFSFLCNITDH